MLNKDAECLITAPRSKTLYTKKFVGNLRRTCRSSNKLLNNVFNGYVEIKPRMHFPKKCGRKECVIIEKTRSLHLTFVGAERLILIREP